MQKFVQIQAMRLPNQNKRGKPAIGVPSMRLTPLLPRNPSFISLTRRNVISNPLDQLIRQQIQNFRHRDNAVNSPHIALPLVIQDEAPLLRGVPHSHQKLVHFLPVNYLVRFFGF